LRIFFQALEKGIHTDILCLTDCSKVVLAAFETFAAFHPVDDFCHLFYKLLVHSGILILLLFRSTIRETALGVKLKNYIVTSGV
jgi:hypothetical protein